ncbi:leucine-rich repeat-containing protein 74A-like [Gigantopelta aegis]|uniref:leucine-rich repeat-containing protein 74A-like n=1 Tax=Gigantopelta aegis TaxID=1735272 RepID=UPI001B887F87|nr:leucine-rich repeat-containing protein 74A-like [Gigantopelta aegis]
MFTSIQFDIWNLIKRPLTADPYQLTARYRLKSAPVRRVKSGIVSRRRRRPESRAESEGDESIITTATTDGAYFFDFDKDLPDDFEFDGVCVLLFNSSQYSNCRENRQRTCVASSMLCFVTDEDNSTGRRSTIGNHSQRTYLRSCKVLSIRPTSVIYKHLNGDKVQLKHHVIGSDGAKACAISLVENSSVQVLDLEDNGISTQGALYIADMLTENTFITDLNVAENNIRTEGAKAIISAIKDMDSIVKLNLSGNNLQEYDGDLIAELLDQSHNLKELYASHNCFRENGGNAIGDAIAWNDTLEVLDLSWNHLRRSGAQAIARGIAQTDALPQYFHFDLRWIATDKTDLNINSGVTVLNLAWNGFYLDGCKEMGKALERNKTLQDLDLSSNRINKQCLDELWKGLKKNSTLKILKLTDNPLTSVGALFILQSIADTKTAGLSELDLGVSQYQSGLVDIDLGSQCVEKAFPDVLEKLQEGRSFKCVFGAVIGQDSDADDPEKDLLEENPVLILMEFGKILGLRLTDLFSMMDKDGSKTLTRAEIKQGLLECNIPLSAKALDVMIEKLDQDGDGEIDYGELMSAHSAHRRKLTKTVIRSREMNVDMEETDVGRIRKFLKMLIAKKRREQALNLSKKKISAVNAIQGKSREGSSKSRPGTAS